MKRFKGKFLLINTINIMIFTTTLLGGCESESEGSKLCPQLIHYTSDCYEQVTGQSPTDEQKSNWLESCKSANHSDSCLNCAMQIPCREFLTNPDAYDIYCKEYCP